ncbi:PucR family transcriptional regulator [Bacillota bacterium Lsc_1132]
MKIAELLQIPIFAEMSIIAGEYGKDRDVDTVNMMDAPDIIDFLKPNELLVTTAYHLKDHPQLLKDLVHSMAKKGCAGLGIKTKRFFQEIPNDAVLLANELGFPIIELPLELSLGAIVNETLRAILNKRTEELRFALEIHKQFTNLLLRGKGIETLLDKLSTMIGFPVILLDRFLKIKRLSPTNPGDYSFKNQLLTNNQLSPTAFSFLETKKTYSVFPIHISEKGFGFLVVLGEIYQSDQLSFLTIEQAANVIGFAFMQENAVKQSERRLRNEFFLNFTNNMFFSPEEANNRATEYSLKNEQSYICAVGGLDAVEHRAGFFHPPKPDLLFEFLEEEILELPVPVHFFTKGDQCILLFEADGTATENTRTIDAALKQLQENVKVQFDRTLSFGLSTTCQNFLNVKNAFNEAVNAFHEGKQSRKTCYIQTYQTKDVAELLRAIPKEELFNFYTFVMQGFIDTETEEEQTLLETLFIYLEVHCQISETAKRLFVHRNTVVYRLEKCEKLLGRSLKDSETTLQLRLAFRIKNLLNLKNS